MRTGTRTKPIYTMSVDKSGVQMKPGESVADPLVSERGLGNLIGHSVPVDYFA